jgi:hypothetical protein
MISIDIATGLVSGGRFTAGCTFVWSNSSARNVDVTPSSNFCTPSSFPVEAGKVSQEGTAANPLPSPPFDFSINPNIWVGGPSNPHIQMPSRLANEKEVA